MNLLTLNTNSTEPTDYTERKTAKGVVINDAGEVLMRGPYLIGGGVEEGETFEEALKREAMEEAGIEIEIIRPLGEVVSYRDALKMKYVIEGYLCKYIKTVSAPTTSDAEEIEQELIWQKPDKAVRRVQEDIKDIQGEDKNLYEGDGYQSRLYNRQMSLALLKEALMVENG